MTSHPDIILILFCRLRCSNSIAISVQINSKIAIIRETAITIWARYTLSSLIRIMVDSNMSAKVTFMLKFARVWTRMLGFPLVVVDMILKDFEIFELFVAWLAE